MSEAGTIRVTEAARETYEKVLRSLECHRPSKVEADIVARLQEKWNLPKPRSKVRGQSPSIPIEEWCNAFDAQGVKVEDFLAIVLEELTPFVNMVLELYSFLCKYVSTTGGRTEHFRIASGDLPNPWDFDTSKLPHQIEWVQSWVSINIQQVETDLQQIGRLLIFDNGVFFGAVGSWRVLQTLVVARRDGFLTPELRNLGDEIRRILLAVLRAHFDSTQATRAAVRDQRPTVTALLPDVFSFLRDEGVLSTGPSRSREGYLSIDLRMLFERSARGYSIGDIFGDFDAGSPIAPQRDPLWNTLAGITFFSSIWGLSDDDFRRVARGLTAHEGRGDLLSRTQLADQGLGLAQNLLQSLSKLVKFTDTDESRRERQRHQLHVLLLPYWKDRWFLYEVWTLLRPLALLLQVGGQLDLIGVTPISDPGVEGATWNLPTQKAKEPVALLRGPKGSLRVWFQRETDRPSGIGHMEPDVRLTLAEEPFADLAIIECKDRVKFTTGALRVAASYAKDSSALEVWVVNYEEPAIPTERVLEKTVDSRRIGVVEGFRPGSPSGPIDGFLLNLFTEHLGVSEPTASQGEFIIVDISGSMEGKVVSCDAIALDFTKIASERVKTWSNRIGDADDGTMRSLSTRQPLRTSGTERPEALRDFAAGLPHGCRLLVMTDPGGLSALSLSGALNEVTDDRGALACLLAGKPARIYVVR